MFWDQTAKTRIPCRSRVPREASLSLLLPPMVGIEASSRRAYTTCATPCSSSSRILNGRSSGKCHSPVHSGSRNCAWGPLPPAAERRPAAIRRSENESLFSMVPPRAITRPSLTTIGLGDQFVHSNPINCWFSVAIAHEDHKLAIGGESRGHQGRVAGTVLCQGQLTPGRPDQ